MTTSSAEGQGHAVPRGHAEVLESFMQFPAPLALATRECGLVQVNEAWTGRFGDATLDSTSLPGESVTDGEEVSVALRLRGHDDVRMVRARVIETPGRILLVVDEPAPARRHDEIESLRTRVSQLEQLAATDHLTGAWNRAHFERVITAELARSVAKREPVSLLLLDIDHFKFVNDTFGHGVGDSVLRELVRLVQSRIRPSDILFRWGGEEFAVLVTGAGYRAAERTAENLRQAVAEHPFRDAGKVTVSLGVAEHAGSEDRDTWFRRLDEALYAAKHAGRDRVVVDRQGNSDIWAMDAGLSALHLVWQEAYECGDPTIDGEHQELFEMANRLIDATTRAETEREAFLASLDALLAHVARHFTDEEAILERLQYADLEPHRRAHQGLLRRAGFLKESALAGEASLGSVVEFLAQDVVARHLLTVDRAFFPLFR